MAREDDSNRTVCDGQVLAIKSIDARFINKAFCVREQLIIIASGKGSLLFLMAMKHPVE